MLLLKMNGLDHWLPVKYCSSSLWLRCPTFPQVCVTCCHTFAFLVFAFTFALAIAFLSFLISLPFLSFALGIFTFALLMVILATLTLPLASWTRSMYLGMGP